MVRDGFYYGAALAAGGALVSYLSQPLFGAPLFVLALFCLYFFRDPDRIVPSGDVAVSPADGKVISIRPEQTGLTRLSIFLNVFDVHVNRSPITGTVADVNYRRGRFLVASRAEASLQNEQNSIMVQGDGTRVEFCQIAGLIARRVVCQVKPGDRVDKGERIGLIKFGSRVDVIFGPEWDLKVTEGERVSAGSSILACRREGAVQR